MGADYKDWVGKAFNFLKCIFRITWPIDDLGSAVG